MSHKHENHQEKNCECDQERTHDCECESDSACGCGCDCGCDCSCVHHFMRRFQTKEEKIGALEKYLQELKLEIKAVEEHLGDLRK